MSRPDGGGGIIAAGGFDRPLAKVPKPVHGIRPNAEDGNMEGPDPLDGELKQQAVEYVIKCFPATFGKRLRAAADTWLSLS